MLVTLAYSVFQDLHTIEKKNTMMLISQVLSSITSEREEGRVLLIIYLLNGIKHIYLYSTLLNYMKPFYISNFFIAR